MNIMVIGKTVKNMAKVFSHIPMEIHIQAGGSMENVKAKGLIIL